MNRAAKRHRDAAEKCYLAGVHSLAGHSSRHKKRLYRLKDKGIAEAARLGRLTPTEMHGSLCLYRGEGYCFHSTLRPVGVELPVVGAEEPVFIDAKPQGAKEPLQRDTIAMLESLIDVDESRFVRTAAPTIARLIECHNCGELGHFARECPYDYQADQEYDDYSHF